jgi:hypothetical protein
MFLKYAAMNPICFFADLQIATHPHFGRHPEERSDEGPLFDS